MLHPFACGSCRRACDLRRRGSRGGGGCSTSSKGLRSPSAQQCPEQTLLRPKKRSGPYSRSARTLWGSARDGGPRRHRTRGSVLVSWLFLLLLVEVVGVVERVQCLIGGFVFPAGQEQTTFLPATHAGCPCDPRGARALIHVVHGRATQPPLCGKSHRGADDLPGMETARPRAKLFPSCGSSLRGARDHSHVGPM